MTKHCYICEEPIPIINLYCGRCRRHLPFHNMALYAKAMKAAWNPNLNAFICFYTGMILGENDRSSPWYLTFDHRIPGDDSTLVVCAHWVNDVKTSLSDVEFKAVTIELDRSHEAKEPFNMAVADFKYWIGPAYRKPKKLKKPAYRIIPTISECIICHHKPPPHNYYCPACKKITLSSPNMKEWLPALQAAWNEARQCFVCYLTSLEIELVDRKSPRYRTLDHRIPRRPGTQALSVAFANGMKAELTEEEFRLVIHELADHFRTGKPFNRDIVKFSYWSPPRIAREARK